MSYLKIINSFTMQFTDIDYTPIVIDIIVFDSNILLYELKTQSDSVTPMNRNHFLFLFYSKILVLL